MVEQIDLVAEEGQEIGRGGFGIVRKHSWNDITVAVKWFPKTITIDNIKNEVGALARLNHENVINIEAIAMDNGSIGLVMPFMQSDLFRFLHVQGNAELLTGDEKNVLSIGITKGVQFIHQNGIIHRDLKSLNVLLDEHRTPKICDFGMAKTKSMTKGSFRGGTMAYLSPELLSRKAPHSIQSDVYALGLILFEIYSGVVVEEAFNDIGQIPNAIIRQLISYCINEDPTKRPLTDKILSVLTLASAPTMTAEDYATIQATLSDLPSKSAEEYLDLAIAYYKGVNVEQDVTLALEHLEKASNLGDPAAQVWLGFCYQRGIGVDFNHEHALELYRKSAQTGNAAALFNLGYCHEHGIAPDETKAYSYYEQAALKGHPTAQNNLANLLYIGKHVPQNLQQALYWFDLASKQGNLEAINNYANMLFHGEATPQNFQLASQLYAQAAQQGLAEAQNNLGMCYYYGYGVQQSLENVRHWFERASEQNHPEAQNNLGMIYEHAQEYEKAFEMYQKSAFQGFKLAMEHLADCYKNGIGVERDDQKGNEWLAKSL